jgi:endonuclease/exonuclease/phosphatase family metal-dependent hydrolase
MMVPLSHSSLAAHRPLAAVVTLIGLLAVARADAADDADPDPGTLRVISYNVQFLPGVARAANKRKQPEYRAAELGRLLGKFDLVGLNEVFDDGPRAVILAGVKQAWGADYYAISGPTPGDGRYNGGLALASRYPFLETHEWIYTVASSPKDHGVRADGFAAKGVLHARIWRGGTSSHENFVDVFVTHLEARVEEIRHQQFGEFAAFVAQHSTPERPIIMLGDFNTRGNSDYVADPASPYHLLIRTIADAIPEHDVLDLWLTLKADQDGGTSEQEGSDGGRRIDYVFVAQPKSGASLLEPADVRVNRFLDEKVGALSDHSAVEADLRWSDD